MASSVGLLPRTLLSLLPLLLVVLASSSPLQVPPARDNDTVTRDLFFELEQLARIVDISYCVGTAGFGIQKPFSCPSHCADQDFKHFELLTTWNTGPLLSDSCGYIALSHPPSPPRILLAFRGTYSIANTIVDLSTMPQEYVPYPGNDDDDHYHHEPSTPDFLAPLRPPAHQGPPPANPPRCHNCTVHTGFYTSWLHTRKEILPQLTAAIEAYPAYELVLVGHSLGGAVATLAGLDFHARGWNPRVTTFGEPRIGNQNLMAYLNARFNITADHASNRLHRVTHVNDPVPLLPLAEWGYTMHGEEIFISAPDLPFDAQDIHHCQGDEDPKCIAGTDPDGPSWGIPARFKFWQLFFAHRDYFWRLGMCVPGGDPKDWYRKYPKHDEGDVDGIEEIGEL